jgi:IS605 OrfB family transposase
MIRSSKHILKYQTELKSNQLNDLSVEFEFLVQKYIDLIWSRKLELKLLMSSKELPSSNKIKHSRWKQLAYKTSSEMVRSVINKKTKNKTKPIYKNISINIDERFIDIEVGKSTEFDEFVKLTLPFMKEGVRRANTIKLPIRHHKHSNKFRLSKKWKRKKTVRLEKRNGNFYISFMWECETKSTSTNQKKSIGFDCGYKKLLVDSSGNVYGKELELIYKKISNKQQKSKNFKKSLTERNNKVNEVINSIDLSNVDEVIVENLKFVKHKTKGKIRKSFNNKLQRWIYAQVLRKLEQRCEENGILFTMINPAYTSQTCSKCGISESSSRVGEKFKCISCGFEIDADENAAINILHRGAYSPSTSKT